MSRTFKKGEQLSAIITLAAAKFINRFDLQGQPYVLHCLKVMHYLKSNDEELQCIAVGHDLLEDTDVTAEELAEIVSERVIFGIKLLTHTENLSYDEYIERIIDSASVDAMRVKLADLRHNSDIRRLKGIGPKDAQRLDRYARAYTKITAKLYPNL